MNMMLLRFFSFLLFPMIVSVYGSPKDVVIDDVNCFSHILIYLKYREIVGLKLVKKSHPVQLHAASLACSENDLELVIQDKRISEAAFANILRNECFQHVKKLDFHGSLFDIKWLERMPDKIEILSLAYVNIFSGENFIKFHEWISIVLKRFSCLKKLDLSGNFIGDSMIEFGRLDSQAFTHLETLIVKDCGISSDPMEHLVHCSSLKTLDLSHNNIYHLCSWFLDAAAGHRISTLRFHETFMELIEQDPSFSIPYFPHLESLILEDNRLHDYTMQALALLPQLKLLNLNNNSKIGDTGLCNFFQLLVFYDFSKIETLDLCSIGLQDLSALNLKLLPALSYLALGGNSFHREGVSRFLDLYREYFLKIKHVILSDDEDSSRLVFMLNAYYSDSSSL